MIDLKRNFYTIRHSMNILLFIFSFILVFILEGVSQEEIDLGEIDSFLQEGADKLVPVTALKEGEEVFEDRKFESSWGGDIFFTGAIGDLVERNNFDVRFFAEQQLNAKSSLKIDFRYVKSERTLFFESEKFETSPRGGRQRTGVVEDVERTFSQERLKPRDISLSFDGGSHSATVGYQTFSFGQIPNFSPMDFVVLPSDFDDIGVTATKIDRRVAQLAYKQVWSPSQKWQVEFYYLPLNNISESQEESNESPVYSNEYSEKYGSFLAFDFEVDLPEESDRFILRSLYYGDRATVELLAYKGPNLLEPTEFSMVVRDPTGNSNRVARVVEEVDYFETTIFGISVSIPYREDQHAIKFEAVFQEVAQELYDPHFFDSGYNDAVRDLNDNKLWVEGSNILIGGGWDLNYEKWHFDLYFYVVFQNIGSLGKELRDVYQSITSFTEIDEHGNTVTRPFDPNERSIDFEISPLFALNAYKKVSEKKTYGFALGIIGSSLGVTYYYTIKQTDNLTWGFNVGAIDYRSDIEFEQRSSEEDLSLRSGLQPQLGFGLNYKF